MRQHIRHMCLSLSGIWIILLSGTITFGYLYLAGEFNDHVPRDYACQNMAASLLFIIVFVKYVFWEKKGRWLHYYLVAYAIFVGIFIEVTDKAVRGIVQSSFDQAIRDLRGTLYSMSLVLVPFAFAIILLFDEIKQSIMKSRTTPTSK